MLYSSCYIVDTIYNGYTEKSVFIPCEYNFDICNNNVGFVIPCDNDIIYDPTNCPNIKINNVCNFRKCDITCEYYKCYNNIIDVSIMSDNIYLPTLTIPSISNSIINEFNILIYLLLFIMLN